MIKKIKSDKIKLLKMASGNLYIVLSSEVEWSEFPEFLSYIVDLLNAKIEIKYESVESAIWEIVIDKIDLRLVFDDYPQEVTLESTNEDGDKKLVEIFDRLAN